MFEKRKKVFFSHTYRPHSKYIHFLREHNDDEQVENMKSILYCFNLMQKKVIPIAYISTLQYSVT